MKYVSAFAGIGGFECALDSVGFECVAQIENNARANEVLRYNYPNVNRWSNISHVKGGDLPDADLFVGGFPCSDLSGANTKRTGLRGERSGLFFEFHRLLTERRPKYFIIENVSGLLSSGVIDRTTGEKRKGVDLAIVLAGLTGFFYSIPERGWGNAGVFDGTFYNVAYRIFDAQYTGIPQRRRRIFIVGCLRETGRSAAEILFDPDFRHRNSETSRKSWQAHRKSIEESTPEISGTILASGAGTERAAGTVSETDLLVPVYRMRAYGEYYEDIIASTVQSRDYKSPTDLVVSESFDVRNLKNNGEIVGTVQSKSTGGYSLNYQDVLSQYREDEPIGVRRYTPLEVERIQGFPDGYTEFGIKDNGKQKRMSDSARYRLLGNAVPPTMVKPIAERIIREQS